MHIDGYDLYVQDTTGRNMCTVTHNNYNVDIKCTRCLREKQNTRKTARVSLLPIGYCVFEDTSCFMNNDLENVIYILMSATL